MRKIVEIIKDEARVSHRLIAENTSNKLQSIQDLIARNISDFKEFGALEVEEKKVKNSVGAINIQKTYFLNEPQATLLMTYLRNSEVVKEFKKKLVKAFYAMKQEREQVVHTEMNSVIPVLQMMVKQQDSMLEILRMLAQNQTAMMEQQQMILQRQEAYERPMALPSTLSLTPEQLGKIRGAVNMAAEAVLLCFENDNLTRVQKLIYTKLNNALGTPSYIYIPAIAFNEALEIIKERERKHITLFEEREAREKKMDASINGVDSLEVPQF